MTDIIERLREDYPLTPELDRVKAADTIEALRAENAKLRELLKPFMKENFPDYFDDGRVIPISASCGAIRAARTATGEME